MDMASVRGWSSKQGVIILIVATLALVLIERRIADVAFALLLLSGLYILLTDLKIWSQSEMRFCSAAIGTFLLIVVFSSWWNGWGEFASTRIRTYAHLLAFLPLFALFRRVVPPVGVLWWGAVLSAFGAGVYSLYIRYEASSIVRISGETYPILFGDISVLMSLLSLLALPYFYNLNRRFGIVLPLAAFCMGFYAIYASMTRNAYLSIILLGVLLLVFYWRSVPRWGRMVMLLMSAALPLIIVALPDSNVDSAINNVSGFMGGERSELVTYSSSGQRLVMWSVAWDLFTQQPLLGGGLGSFKQYFSYLNAEGVVSVPIIYSEPHNEYLKVLAEHGALGFTSAMAIFLIPLYLVVVRLRNSNIDRELVVAGTLVVVGYMLFALTESIFSRALFGTIYVFMTALILAMLSQQLPAEQWSTKSTCA